MAINSLGQQAELKEGGSRRFYSENVRHEKDEVGSRR